MKMINKKKLFLAMGILVLAVISFFYFQNENEKKEERKVLENFVKEHNASIKYKVEKTNLCEDVQKISFKTDKNESEENGEELKPLIQEKEISFENREIKPYTEPLPEMPDEEVAKKIFVDENQNGVRDDIEIPIVKEFGSDRDLVEAFFAAARSSQRMLYISDNELFDDKNMQEVLDDDMFSYDCGYQLFKNSKFSTGNNSKDLDIYSNYINNKYIWNKAFNTKDRLNRYKKFDRHAGGFAIGGESESFKKCLDFFQKTKSWNFD